MDISEVKDRDPDLVDALVAVWESSVRATHLFLSELEILGIRGYVPEVVSLVEHLIVAVDDEGSPVAFMGVQDGSIEMLFIKPQERGKGLGRRLVEKGIGEYSVNRLAVNEQNPAGHGILRAHGLLCIQAYRTR